MRNEEIDELGNRVYREHQRTPDTIVEQLSERQNEVGAILVELIN